MGKGFGGRSGGGFGMPDMAKLAKMAQKMQEDMVVAEEELAGTRVEAVSGGGAVKAVVNGKGKIISLEIKPEAVDPNDVEMLQDLIVVALKEAEDKAEQLHESKMKGLTGGMGVPGLF